MLHRLHERKGHIGSIYQLLEPSPKGDFWSVAGDGWLVHWPAQEPDLGRMIARVEGGQFFCALLLPSLAAFVVGAMDGGLHWLYPTAPDKNQHLAHHRKGIYALVAVGDFLFAGGGDGLLSKWSIATNRVVESLPLAAGALRSFCYDPARELLFVGSSDHHIYAIDPASLHIQYQWKAHESSVFCLALSPDGKYLLSGGRDAYLRRWQLQTALPPLEDLALPAHNFTINDLAFSPDGKWLVTASRDKTLKVWDGQTLKLHKVAEGIRDRGHVNSVNTVLWLDQDRFLSGSDDRRILEWSLTKTSVLATK